MRQIARQGMSRIRWMVAAFGVVMAGLWGLVAYMPVYLPTVTPAMLGAQPARESGPQDVFGYATLTHPLVRFLVIGRPVPAAPAKLEGFLRDGRDLRPDSDSVVAGQVFTVGPEGLLRLDRYERLGERYRRDLRTLTDGRKVWVYQLLPEARQ
jgi:hypothetical protein